MKIKNFKITPKGLALVLSGTMTLTSLTWCNKQIVDFNKSFNVALETNNGYVSIAGIKAYSDYEGGQVQFITEDGLVVLTSTRQTQLIKTNDTNKVNKYAKSLTGNDEDKIMDYNKMQGVCIDVSFDSWNKDIFDFHYKYDKAIILSEEKATIVNVKTWKDYEEDDKIQLKLDDDNYILTNIDNVKLINDDNAKEDSLYNYAVSLVGSEENVIYYDNQKNHSK